MIVLKSLKIAIGMLTGLLCRSHSDPFRRPVALDPPTGGRPGVVAAMTYRPGGIATNACGPGEVLFRNCRENGVVHRLTEPRSPTAAGKIERFHLTLRCELLDGCEPFTEVASRQYAPAMDPYLPM